MNKRALKFLSVIMLILSLCGCQNADILKAEYNSLYSNPPTERIDFSGVGDTESIINNTDLYDERITTELDIHKFSEKYGANFFFYGNSKIKEIAADIGIECLRRTENGALYSVHKVNQGGLLYIFYHTYIYDQSGNFEDVYMNNWFYVNKKLSSSDFKNIKKGKSTIQDIIRINPSEQIWENIFCSNIEAFSLSGMVSRHYLQDGIYYIQYSYIDGEFVVDYAHLEETFDLDDSSLSIYRPYDAHILDIDWIK